jgi:hypothetical protein
MEFYEIFLAFEPLADLRRFVIRCVVSDEVDLSSTVVPDQLAQKLDERLGVKHLYEVRMPLWFGADPDCAHDFNTLANRRTEHVDSDSDECPCPDNGAGLLKDRFIPVEHYTAFTPGFFLISGSSLRNQVL